ncbi:MAG: 16S rRNA (uracil(1498)-N(3))-methyltransferase [Proteobacteria bacterium]|nr:16S rRNA (uracil(1498)-N(3))-methyltransferase [Pseudomonadota bacterium]
MTRAAPRLFVEGPLSSGRTLTLDKPRAHYLLTVMRLKTGDSVRLFNGRDGEWSARIIDAARDTCGLAVEARTRPQDKGPDLWLLPSPIKRGPFEFMVEKAVELGVSGIRPVISEYTQRSKVNTDRLRTIAIEAAEQSERLSVPEIIEPRPLADQLADWPGGRRLLFCDESGEAPPLADVLTGRTDTAGKVVSGVGQLVGDVLDGLLGPGGPGSAPAPPDRNPWAILIGPEGGFSPDERKRLRAHGSVVAASLGPRVLRADTAAIAALSLWQALLGDWRG